VSKYIALLDEAGVGEKELRKLVDSNESFYGIIQRKAPAMRQLIVTEFMSVDISQLVTGGFMYLFVESMVEMAPWFGQVVTEEWLTTEVELIAKDVENARKS